MAKRRGVWIRPLKIVLGARNGTARSPPPSPVTPSAKVLASEPVTPAADVTVPSRPGPESVVSTALVRGGSPDWSAPWVPTAHGGSIPRESGSADRIRRSRRMPPTPSIWEWWAFM